MALFKVSKGLNTNLPSTLTEGYCWYTYNDSKFYIDFKDENGVLTRKALNANEAEKLTGYDIATILNSSDVEIPTSQAILTALNTKADTDHNHNDEYDVKGSADSALDSAKTYADSASFAAANAVKNDLLNGAGTAYDTLKELGDLIDDNTDAIDALKTIASNKADAEHNHNIKDVSGLQDFINNKPNIALGTKTTSVIINDVQNNKSTGDYATAEGKGTAAMGEAQHVEGKYNLSDSSTYAHIVGNGKSDSERSNAHTIDWSGNAWFRGGIKISGENFNDGLELATKSYVDNHLGTKNSYHIRTSDSYQSFVANALNNNTAEGTYGAAFGYGTKASGTASTAFNAYTEASNNNATAFGHTTLASGNSAIASGRYTEASGTSAVAMGFSTADEIRHILASGQSAIAGGYSSDGKIESSGLSSIAIGISHADGDVIASGDVSVAIGDSVSANARGAVAFGAYNTVDGQYSFVSGSNSIVHAENSTCEGAKNIVGCKGFYVRAVQEASSGYGLNIYLGTSRASSVIRGTYSENINTSEYWLNSSEGTVVIYFSDSYNNVVFKGSISNSTSNFITLNCTSEEERQLILSEIPFDTEFTVLHNATFAVVYLDYINAGRVVFGNILHCEGELNYCLSNISHVEGTRNMTVGAASHTEGADNIAFGNNSHVEGQSNIVYGNDAHGEGRYAVTKGNAAHSEGGYCYAIGDYSHAEGKSTRASGYGSHSAGVSTIADGYGQTAVGVYNESDTNAKFVVGAGNSDTERLNAFTVGKNADGECYLTLGSITITESQLAALLTASFDAGSIIES